MSVWDLYANRVTTDGKTQRDAMIKREKLMLNSKLKNSLSYHSVKLDGYPKDVAIVNTDNLNIKYIYSMPDDDLHCGGLVKWMNNYWLITEKDANNEVYTKAKMTQCNHLLKWIDDAGKIHKQWCVIEDGTKYLTGELEDRNFVVTRGDSRIAMTIGRNEHTIKFNRECRFIIDDTESEHKLAYALTKPLKTGWTYNGDGVFCFVLQEVTTTDFDNQELGIADYYKHFKKPQKDGSSDSTDMVAKPVNPGDITEDGKKVWL